MSVSTGNFVTRGLKFYEVKLYTKSEGIQGPPIQFAAHGQGAFVIGPDGETPQGIAPGQYYAPFEKGYLVFSPTQYDALLQRSFWQRNEPEYLNSTQWPLWAEDRLYSDVAVGLSFIDRLRVLFTGRLTITIKTYTEFAPGAVESASEVFVHPIFGWLRRFKRRPSGSYSQEKEPEPGKPSRPVCALCGFDGLMKDYEGLKICLDEDACQTRSLLRGNPGHA